MSGPHSDSDKKDHQGWGGDEGKRELEDEDWGALDAKTEGAAQTPTKPSTEVGDNTPAAAATPVPEPEDNSKTYEEYLAERAAAGQNAVGGSLSARKANEGSDDSQWKAGQLLEKITTDNFFVGKQVRRCCLATSSCHPQTSHAHRLRTRLARLRRTSVNSSRLSRRRISLRGASSRTEVDEAAVVDEERDEEVAVTDVVEVAVAGEVSAAIAPLVEVVALQTDRRPMSTWTTLRPSLAFESGMS